MSENELRCFRAAMRWQRREYFQQLLRALTPRLPFWAFVRASALAVKIIYGITFLALLPIIVAVWLLRSILQLIIFPFRLFSSFIPPRTLKGPGERNLQGIHNAFIQYVNLSPAVYMLCVNEWIAILYGPQALQKHRMDKQVSIRNMALFGLSNPVLSEVPLRNAISQARETLSKQLGHY